MGRQAQPCLPGALKDLGPFPEGHALDAAGGETDHPFRQVPQHQIEHRMAMGNAEMIHRIENNGHLDTLRPGLSNAIVHAPP